MSKRSATRTTRKLRAQIVDLRTQVAVLTTQVEENSIMFGLLCDRVLGPEHVLDQIEATRRRCDR